ncbi:MAG: adenylate/guanylate cyclase domain-containing protein, partial [Candidatus Eremiobacteraeota bacterium]|nr:adenylate/guanylate cyclase domain-containing protein [Candidatus Eremiobacteraeota bacterium]
MTADLVGFSSRLSSDETSIIRLLIDSYYSLAEQAVAANGGELFRKEGDAVWCSFTSARGAVQAAIELQLGALTHNRGRGSDNPMHLRVGVHLGEVVVTPDGEILGHTLSVAKRLETACEVDAVHLSEAVYAQLAGLELSFEFEDQGLVDLKGVGPTRTFLGRPRQLPAVVEPSGQLVLAARLDGLAPDRRTDWERSMLGLANRLQGWWKVAEGEVGFLVIPAAAWNELADVLERAPRCGLALGPAMVLEQELYGAAVEEALAALESGFAPEVVRLAGEAGRLAWPASTRFRRGPCLSAFDGTRLLDLAQG